MSVFAKVLRAGEGRKVRSLAGVVPLINSLEPEIEAHSDGELAGKTAEFKSRLERGEDLNDLLVEAFAVVREAARRTIGQRHYDVQLMGGMALHFGGIAEMKTGEGKTLASSLPVYLNGLSGRGVHLVTVNDYLATRDSEWMGQVYRFLGMSVGLIVPQGATTSEEFLAEVAQKKAAYDCDITYGTNTEMGFDYLRDNMAHAREHMVQRGHVYAIVDEVDSILIDEARTPLLISGPAAQSGEDYYRFAAIVRTLRPGEDYDVDLEKHIVVPTEAGIAKVERQLNVHNLYDSVSTDFVHHLQKALEAKELYQRDKDYLVQDGEVKIVDEFTGRIMEGRRWSDGLHQAVEAKERVKIQEENHTIATVTLQNYFRMYEKLAGMTGTAETEAAEFASTYDLHVTPIPTHRPMVRTDEADLVYKTEDAKFNAVVEDLVERYETGQPVLVGTASVERSEHLSRLLEKKGIPHTVLNAKQHFREAAIVAQAGRLHGITVATNMAGRGVDIVLGGNAEGLAQEEALARGLDLDTAEGKSAYEELVRKFTEQCAAEGDEVRALGGLYVLGSERHESRRIDNQLRGRSGRQGDPGESRFYLSLEDELMQLFATGAVNWVMNRSGLPEEVPIEAKMVSRAIEKAQTTVEAKNAEVRKELLKYDDVYDQQRKTVYQRRLDIMDGVDLRSYTEELLQHSVARVVGDCCPNEFSEEWDLPRLVVEVQQYYPTRFTAEELEQAATTDQLVHSLLTEALDYYDQHEESLGGAEQARTIEREVLLQMIDNRWRLHLAELDHLREGIHLRGLAQTDPLNAWQREGYEMFEQLWAAIDDDYLRYAMHLELLEGPPPEDADLGPGDVQYHAQEDPLDDGATVSAPPPPPERGSPSGAAVPARPAAGGRPVTERAKIGRNDPCWCGSGRKYKLCHGAN